jgi:hypothetical protein
LLSRIYDEGKYLAFFKRSFIKKDQSRPEGIANRESRHVKKMNNNNNILKIIFYHYYIRVPAQGKTLGAAYKPCA